MEIDKWFLESERDVKKLSYTNLLAELLYLNYEFSNKKYHGVTGSQIYNSMLKKIKFTEKEKKEIIDNATALIKIKYGVKLEDFENMIFNKL